MLRFLGKIVVLIILLGISSCCSLNIDEERMGLSGQEKQFISRFEDELLIHAANVNLNVQRVRVTSVSDVVEISSKKVEPLVYNQLLSTEDMEPEVRKNIFIAQMLPHILIVKYYLDQEKEILEQILKHEKLRRHHSPERHIFVKKMLVKHNAENTNELLQKLTTPPTSVILAQAAFDSDWGRSDSYSKANNPFKEPTEGEPGPLLHTLGSPTDLIFLKDYSYPPEAIVDYFNNINTQDSYRVFREKRRKTSDPLTLIKSIRSKPDGSRHGYSVLLTKIITENGLGQFDQYVIDPRYLNKPSEDKINEIIDSQYGMRQKNSKQQRKDYADFGDICLEIQKVTPKSDKDIFAIKGEYVVPYVYTNAVNLETLPVNERKRTFFNMMLPAILVASHEIEEARLRVQELAASMEKGEGIAANDLAYLERLLKEWEADNVYELLESKLIVYPSSIMLAQAALETGWGTSRFFTLANNTFGIWSFDKKEPRIRAKETRDGKVIYVKKYNDLSESIIDYYKLMANGPYSEYRKAIKAKKNPYDMIPYLTKYSELRGEYVKRLQLVMSQAKLEKFDDYQLDPAYML